MSFSLTEDFTKQSTKRAQERPMYDLILIYDSILWVHKYTSISPSAWILKIHKNIKEHPELELNWTTIRTLVQFLL